MNPHVELCFETDPGRRVMTSTNGLAEARVHGLDPEEVAFSQADRFTVPPERGSGPPELQVNQWHLTADSPSTSTSRRLLSVIVVGRGDEDDGPEVERLESPEGLGARIGETEVLFRLGDLPMAVRCRARRDDGSTAWFEWSGPVP